MNRSSLDLFANRSVFLTGHTGFKGSWLSIWLHRLGARTTGYSLTPPTTPNNFSCSRVEGLLARHLEGDVRDADRLRHALIEADPDVVFHLAAQPLVRLSYDSPRETFEVNAIGTAVLLDAVRARGKPCAVVVVTSDKCYENHGHLREFRETDRLGGYDPYSASKAAAEIVVAAYRQSFFPVERIAEHGIQLASGRAGNVIGGGDWAQDRILADAARSLSAGRAVPVRNPQAVRPWQHVLESLSGYLQLAARMLQSPDAAWCAPWNFGPVPGDHLPVARLVELFCSAWQGGAWEDVHDPNQPHEAHWLSLNIEKSQTQLGWHPAWDASEAVRRAAQWYRRYYNDPKASMLPACIDDLQAYEKVMKGAT